MTAYNWPPRATENLTVAEMKEELEALNIMFTQSRDEDDEGHGGSPGEWMVERMDELETSIKRRAL